jgi:hypothetical protein
VLAATALIGGFLAGLRSWRRLNGLDASIKAMIDLAARNLPGEMRDRLSEEWQSHANDVPTDLGKLLVALGFLIASARLRLAALDYDPSASTLMSRLRLYLSNSENLRRLKRLHAIFTAFGVSLVMIMMVASCAMSGRSPERGLYVALSIAACLWMQIALVWAVHYATRVWPTMLIYATTSAYVAIGLTLALRDQVVGAYQMWLFLGCIWLCVGIVVAGSVIQIFKHDFQHRSHGVAER